MKTIIKDGELTVIDAISPRELAVNGGLAGRMSDMPRSMKQQIFAILQKHTGVRLAKVPDLEKLSQQELSALKKELDPIK